MDNAFKKLPFSKQNRILNSALMEFADKGYHQASTDAIVQRAHISKGSLFNYFGCKQELFYTLCEYTFSHYVEAIFRRYNKEEKDFLQRLRSVIHVKIQVICDNPCIADFLSMILADTSPAMVHYVEEKTHKIMGDKHALLDSQQLFYNIDPFLFRDDVDITRAIHCIIWTFDGFTREITRTLRKSYTHVNYNTVFVEAEAYMEHFRALYYK